MSATSSGLSWMADAPFERARLAGELDVFVGTLSGLNGEKKGRMRDACRSLLELLERTDGTTLQQRWEVVERDCWPGWDAGIGRLEPVHRWSWGPAALVLSRAVRPGWALLSRARLSQWTAWLPAGDPLLADTLWLRERMSGVDWAGDEIRRRGHLLGIRLLLLRGYSSIGEIVEDDLGAVPRNVSKGLDALDALLCEHGVFARTPQRGAQRRLRVGRHTPSELVARSRIPQRFRAAHQLYLEAYAERISDVYATARHKHNALEHLWSFLDERYPQIRGCEQVRREHLLAFIPYAVTRAREVQRGRRHLEAGEDRMTAHQWLVNVRCFFADICTWALEDGSPFVKHAPPAVPLERHDLRNVGFEKARRRQEKRTAATILDLERAMPSVRALASRRWQDAKTALAEAPANQGACQVEVRAFWDWAFLELLVQSGIRIEEACELTTLDVLRRRHLDGRTYYLLHIKPSKFDRARVIPIGDGLGRVIAEIIRHVKAFYRSPRVPDCDHWDCAEKRPFPRAPYLLQGAGHPSPVAMSQIRNRLARLSDDAGVTGTDGTPLRVRPHDCRRVFASEHLNNNTPIHVIQALLGHATLDTVMVYAKLYPSTLVEEYVKTVRATYADYHGPDSLRNPTQQEWQEFAQSCELRDMGTHLCALPAGEHCSRGLVCLGCSHAQPKQSAAPLFRRMLQSHERALQRARTGGEPAGQLAARELEVQRIDGALRRAQELPSDVAAAIEDAA